MNVRYMRANVAVTLWEIISKCDVCLAAPIGPIDQITEVMFQLQSQLDICELQYLHKSETNESIESVTF